MGNSSRTTSSEKPRKKRTDFPLFIHKGTGRWAKKVRGKHRYFGYVRDDPKGDTALKLWLDQRDDLLAGREPRKASDEITLKDLVNHFLTHKQSLVDSGELAKRSLDTYANGCQLLADILGSQRTASDIGPEDFGKVRAALARRYKPVPLTNRIQTVRSVFKHGYEAGLLDKPARFGTFKKPRAKVIRESRLSKGDQDFTAAEVRALLDVATVNMRAMILLGLQCGFGNTDVAELTEGALDLKRGWLDWPRQKTATHRRAPLWLETVEAIQAAMATRPEGAELVFVGMHGGDYIGKRNGYRVAQEFSRAARNAKIGGKGFYCLRRTFQTVGEDARDLTAVQAIMGHIPSESDMSARYRQRISDDRLKDVTDHIREWLWPHPSNGGNGGVA